MAQEYEKRGGDYEVRNVTTSGELLIVSHDGCVNRTPAITRTRRRKVRPSQKRMVERLARSLNPRASLSRKVQLHLKPKLLIQTARNSMALLLKPMTTKKRRMVQTTKRPMIRQMMIKRARSLSQRLNHSRREPLLLRPRPPTQMVKSCTEPLPRRTKTKRRRMVQRTRMPKPNPSPRPSLSRRPRRPALASCTERQPRLTKRRKSEKARMVTKKWQTAKTTTRRRRTTRLPKLEISERRQRMQRRQSRLPEPSRPAMHAIRRYLTTPILC